MPVLESEIEKTCVKIAEKHGCLLLKLEKRRGWPDRLLLASNGRSMFIEFKRPGESLMPMQKHIQQTLRAMRHSSEEVDNYSLFLTLLLALKDSSPLYGHPNPTNKGGQNGLP